MITHVITHVGLFRIYYNRQQAAPLVWCVATHDWELAVASVIIEAPARTAFKHKTTQDHEDGMPSAWLEVSGVLSVIGSTARITDHTPEPA